MGRCISAVLAYLIATFGFLLAAHADGLEAGFASLALTDPVQGGPMPGIVVYPTKSGAGSTRLGSFTISAERETAPAPGSHPLIVFSHGTGGSDLGHHDSLTALARAGFVAASVEHPRDNYRDDSGFATDLQLIGRPHHIVALIDGVLSHPTIGAVIDKGRIGMVGHSAGGYTALLIAGAAPNFALATAYREAVPSDPYMQRARQVDTHRRKPDLQYVHDPRVRAIVLLAPALGHVFDRDALAKVQVPARIYRPAADEMLVHPWHADRIAQFLPVPPEYEVVEGAGHFVFLAPCSWMFALKARQICTDPSGVDRTAIHARMNSELITFFHQKLPAK